MKKWTDADMLAFANKMVGLSTRMTQMGMGTQEVEQEDLDSFNPAYAFNFLYGVDGKTSIARMSDGVIFHIGDKVNYTSQKLFGVGDEPCEIHSFSFRKNNVFINDHYVGNPDLRISDWVKYKEPYSLQTEDGVTLVEGERCYQVSKGQCYVTWMVARPNMKNGNEVKYFAFEANAQKYADTFKLPTDHIHDLIKKLVRTEVENQLNGTKKTD